MFYQIKTEYESLVLTKKHFLPCSRYKLMLRHWLNSADSKETDLHFYNLISYVHIVLMVETVVNKSYKSLHYLTLLLLKAKNRDLATTLPSLPFPNHPISRFYSLPIWPYFLHAIM